MKTKTHYIDDVSVVCESCGLTMRLIIHSDDSHFDHIRRKADWDTKTVCNHLAHCVGKGIEGRNV